MINRLPLAARLAALLALAPSAAQAQDGWTASVNEYGLRRAQAEGRATLGEAEVPAVLQLTCTSGTGGAVTWTLSVQQKDALVGFDFDAFEGPDATAADKALSHLELQGGMLRTAFDTAQGGYYTDASTFAFELSAPANSASQAGLLAETVDPTTESIRWIVRAPDGSDRRIEAIVPAKGASLALRETMMGCGPVPPLEESRVGAWRGRNPAASGLFDDRAIQWRMKGLLGSGYDAVRERLATAQPAAVTDHVLYVLAPAKDDAKAGAAVLFALGSGDVEVITIDAGAVTRRDRDDKPLPLPDEVREFVAARTTTG